jgi:hypothetical protein
VESGRWELNSWEPSDEFDYDISNRPWPKNITAKNQEIHGKIADIMFTDPEHRLLTLRPGSPGVDAGKIISLKEFDWNQSYEGAAPDVGAYENGKLVEGPPFRYRVVPNSIETYKETPRIVRHKLANDTLFLWYSSPLVSSSFGTGTISVWAGNEPIPVHSVSVASDGYRVALVLASRPLSDHVAVTFHELPKDRNGQTATTWGSTIPIKR